MHPYVRVSHAPEAGYLQSRLYLLGLSGYQDQFILADATAGFETIL